jgi:transposase
MPKYNNPRRTWKYSNEFKVNAIQLSFAVGVTIKSVAEKLDIHPFMVSRWRKEYREVIIVADKRKSHFLVGYCLRFHVATHFDAVFSKRVILEPR